MLVDKSYFGSFLFLKAPKTGNIKLKDFIKAPTDGYSKAANSVAVITCGRSITQDITGMHFETTDEDMFRMSYAHLLCPKL
jgi:hypothetical protein